VTTPSAILYFDTETGGLPRHDLPLDHDAQPQIVQLAALLEVDGIERGSFSVIVDQEGRAIPPEVARVHGIDDAIAARCGIAIEAALGMWLRLARRAALLVGHNVTFDIEIIRLAFAALGMPTACTKDMAEPILRLPPTERMRAIGFGHKFKAPNLGECIRHLFGEELDGAHDALVDVRACRRVYRHIVSLPAMEPAA
jgi:DNA polymerase-3 subunit epsilon